MDGTPLMITEQHSYLGVASYVSYYGNHILITLHLQYNSIPRILVWLSPCKGIFSTAGLTNLQELALHTSNLCYKS